MRETDRQTRRMPMTNISRHTSRCRRQRRAAHVATRTMKHLLHCIGLSHNISSCRPPCTSPCNYESAWSRLVRKAAFDRLAAQHALHSTLTTTTRRALGRAHLPPTKVFRRLKTTRRYCDGRPIAYPCPTVGRKTILKPRLAAAVRLAALIP